VSRRHHPHAMVHTSNRFQNWLHCLLCVQDWCRANGAEVLAVQPPGRNMRSKERCITTVQELARQVLQVVGSRLYDVPYVVSILQVTSSTAGSCSSSLARL
jgi:hypothetical protein